ncbi:MAG: Flp family type IVb pilin [Beijerinckiaceae bacterium]|nr:Flp family type IVb pilin [Beijerinckiaceae bacterium]
MLVSLKRFLKDDNGATALEYGLIMSLMTIACIAAFMALGAGSEAMWNRIRDLIGAALR